MSRAFVKENDDDSEELPERPVSSAVNWVTPTGLAAIEAEIDKLNGELAAASTDDRQTRARVGRDLRYWIARRGSAKLAPAPKDAERVQFGVQVTIRREDGREESFRIVGEDEAEPSAGTISHVSPLARAVAGKSEGDVVRLSGADVEILALRL